MEKVKSDLDFFLPFRQHAPSLANARKEIFANVDRLASPTGFFNVLTFRGVFFGSPFAQSDHFKWFDRYEDWESFRIDEKEEAKKDGREEEEYYVKKSCYGRSQRERSTNLIEGYWKQRHLWNTKFDQTMSPTVELAYHWLISTEKGKSLFRNIGSLTALLICGDLAEAGLVPMPSAKELGKLIFKVRKGAKEGMTAIGLIGEEVNEEELGNAFESLDLALKQELTKDEKETMGYNIFMLEHTLCKIKRLLRCRESRNSLPLFQSEIN